MAGADPRMFEPKFGIRGVIVILGGVMIHLALGSYYMFGNYSPYIVSYLRNRTSEADVRNVDALWITGTGNFGNIIGMVAGGALDRLYGPRIATLVGSFIFCGSVILTYFSVQHSLAWIAFTYGFLGDLGNFMAYIPPVQAAMKWLPKRVTLASGLIVCGFGGGTLVFSQVLTAYINPDNYSPDNVVADDEKYFTQEDLLDRVPKSFLVLGFIYLGMQLLGIACLTNPPKPEDICVHVEGFGSGSFNSKMKDKAEGVATNVVETASEKAPLVDTKSQAAPRKPVLDLIKECLRVRSFYILFVMILCNMFAMQFVSAVDKAYGQNFISDDQFLALAVAISSVFNCIGRPIWGLVNDRFGYKVTMCCITAGFAVVVGTFSLTEHLYKAGFMIWLCAMFFFYSGIWSTLPATFGKLFGVENTGITMGLTGLATAIAAITAGITGVTLKASLGWHGLFYLSSGIIAIAFFTTFLFNGKDRYGKKI